MTKRDHVAAESFWLHRIFAAGPSRVSLTGGKIHIEGLLGGVPEKIPIARIATITVRRSWFWHGLTIRLNDGTVRSIGGLDEGQAARVRDATVAEAVQCARTLSRSLRRLDYQRRQLFAGGRYARHRSSVEFHDALVPVLQECKGLIRECLEQEAKDALEGLADLERPSDFETARRRANDLFVSDICPVVQTAATTALEIPLTDEQAEAVATDEDVTLVLAGAGTGKTRVIASKVAHLVCNQNVAPDEILVLAFNRAVADEIRERLGGDLSSVSVHTFHKFGRSVIAGSGIAPTISKLAEDELALKRTVGHIVGELLKDPEQSKAVIDFITYHQAPYRSAFEFDTLDEYEEYVRRVELRTLSGDLVRSFEELAIANYLSEHGIKFRYEEPYKIPTATPERGQYRPDFFLPDYDIYIEHFALNEEGRPPPGWAGYAEDVKWKRRTHGRNGSALTETYSWQYRRGALLPTLRNQLEEAGVHFEQAPLQTLVSRLAREQTPRLAGLLATFLNHVKSSDLSSCELRTRTGRTGDRRRNEVFLDVFDQVHARYQQCMADKDELDFHDLINRAASNIRAGRWKHQYRYVLVDEFQDISTGRMKLLQALRRPDMAFFLVGDDWQSIYRFAGSDVSLVRGCGDRLGYVQERNLSRTFRFGHGILGPSTAFVQQNPEQTQRSLWSASGVRDQGVTVIFDHRPSLGVARALQDIEASAHGEQHCVLALGRYRNSSELLAPLGRSGKPRVDFSTVHGAKGREADYAVVLDLKDGRWGFPSMVEDDPLLELVLPPVSGSAYPFAEERRLFYVAMTRARIGAYLVTDPVQPSPFVEELIMGSDGLRLIGEPAPDCPRCRRGRLRPLQSLRKLRCSNSSCGRTALPCPNCTVGYALVASRRVVSCTNEVCDRPPAACPRCGKGFLIRTDGRRGPFWGCTEFRSEPSCRYKRDIRERAIGFRT